METRKSEGPVGSSKRADDVGTSGGKYVIYGVGGGDYASTATGSGVASLPGYDVAGFFSVKSNARV